MTFGIFSERLFDLIPIARHVLVEPFPARSSRWTMRAAWWTRIPLPA
jgi:hypothetical protein